MPLEKDLKDGDRWEFDADVAESFDDMLARSIPQYDVMRKAVFDVGSEFVQIQSAVVDLGCARGEALAPFVDRFGAHNRYVGVEVSEPMLAAAQERFAAYDGSTAWDGRWLVEMRKGDLRNYYPPERASLTLSVLTLQFVPIEYRPRVLHSIAEHLVPGGALVLVEKVLGESAATNDAMVTLYHERKAAVGYSAEEIVRKAAALEGVLVPVTAKMNVEFLRNAGFRTVECFWRWMNFAAWVALP